MHRNAALILIVDDDPCGARILESILSNQNYDFVFAETGEDALRKAAELSPDLILLDVIMPGMNGFEVCRRLRATPGISEAPVVMVTELEDQESRIAGIEAGADDFISKPLRREELLARVRGITRLNRFRMLLAERDRFEWMVETSADGYAATDGSDILTYANPTARAFLGLGADWAPGGEHFLDAARKNYHLEPRFAWADWGTFSEEAASKERYLVQPETNDSGACWLRCDIRDQTLGDQVRRIVRLHNVTDKVSAMREMRTFHSMLSHKLRTPLYQAQSGVEMLADEELSLSPEESKEIIQVAMHGIQRLSEEILDILQFLETPTAHEPGDEFSLDGLPGLVANIADQLSLPGVTVSLAEDVARAKTTLSARIVEWVIWELLENSKKFHPEKKPLVEVSAFLSKSGLIRIRVVDDGSRIPPDQMIKVWDPYFQCEKRFTGEIHGMGLGLSMVAVLAWQAGGFCRIANRDDARGVVVDVTLPRFEE